jgi:NTP pyrophosphatase (non-canonical NTP hydrolase)
MPMTFGEFSQANRERCEHPHGFNHPLSSWSTSDWFLAMMGELGEAANVAKKLNRVRDGIVGNKEMPEVLRAKLRRELGDTFVYLDLTCQALGFSIADAAMEVFNAKSAEIGYPKQNMTEEVKNMYTVEYANGDDLRRNSDRKNLELNCEVVERSASGVPRIVCLASHDDAVRIAAFYNASERRVPRHDDEELATVGR